MQAQKAPEIISNDVLKFIAGEWWKEFTAKWQEEPDRPSQVVVYLVDPQNGKESEILFDVSFGDDDRDKHDAMVAMGAAIAKEGALPVAIGIGFEAWGVSRPLDQGRLDGRVADQPDREEKFVMVVGTVNINCLGQMADIQRGGDGDKVLEPTPLIESNSNWIGWFFAGYMLAVRKLTQPKEFAAYVKQHPELADTVKVVRLALSPDTVLH